MLKELSWACRAVRKDLAATAAVVLSLSLGIGFNIAAFSYVDAVLLKPLPFEQPDDLVVLWGSRSPRERPGVNADIYDTWRQRSLTVSRAAPFQLTSRDVAIGPRGGDALKAAVVGGGLFGVLGVRPFLGSDFADVDSADRDRAVILSHSLWSAQFGGDSTVVGRTILVDGRQREVIGVMPDGFFFPSLDVRLWLPLAPDEPFQAVARLRSGSSIEQLLAELNGFPGAALGAFSYRTLIVGPDERASWVLYGIVTLLLIAACANLSVWLLARAVVRERDMAVRQWLGASWSRTAAAAMAEAVVVVGLAGLAAIGWAYFVVRAIVTFGSFDIPRVDSVTVDARTMAYALLACALVAAVSSVAPVVLHTRLRGSPLTVLRGGHGIARVRRSQVMRALVAFEIVAASVLLVVSGQLTNSFVAASRIDWGFDPRSVVVSEVTFPAPLTTEPAAYTELTERLVSSLRGIPGVQTASVAQGVPLKLRVWTPVQVSAGGRRRDAGMLVVGADYFQTLGIPLREGREFTIDDRWQTSRVAVVSDGFATLAWPQRSAVGEQLTFLRLKPEIAQRWPRGRVDDLEEFRRITRDPSSYEPDGPPWTVVGVAADVEMFASGESAASMVYLSHTQRQGGFARPAYIVRTDGSDASIVEGLRDRIRVIAPGARIDSTFTMEALVSRAVGATGSVGLLTLVSIALVALALALEATGVYSVSALFIRRRRNELAVRRALGAGRWMLLRDVLAPEAMLVVLATSLGLVVAWWCSVFVAEVLGDPPRFNRGVYGVAGTAAVVVAFVAMLKPLLIAAGERPADALRSE